MTGNNLFKCCHSQRQSSSPLMAGTCPSTRNYNSLRLKPVGLAHPILRVCKSCNWVCSCYAIGWSSECNYAFLYRWMNENSHLRYVWQGILLLTSWVMNSITWLMAILFNNLLKIYQSNLKSIFRLQAANTNGYRGVVKQTVLLVN